MSVISFSTKPGKEVYKNLLFPYPAGMNQDSLTLPLIADGEDKSCPIKNRVRKNYRHIRKWAKRTLTDAFRLYDREIPEYPLAIDFYAGRFCVQYFSKDRDCDEPSAPLKEEIDQALCSLFSLSPDCIFWRSRIKRGRIEQYEKRDTQKEFFTVFEYGAKFWINLQDYLDTGLFLDHRETRKYVASCAKGARLLNLFAYTCSFSVHAALAGAIYTKSVDMSNTYLDWGKRNFILNEIDVKHHDLVRADCLRFLEEERSLFDLIVIDPPTISRSKKMEQMFDVQIDYPFLLKKSLKLLRPGGKIFFSTNLRSFKLDSALFENCTFKEISDKTAPFDFQRRMHRCWIIS